MRPTLLLLALALTAQAQTQLTTQELNELYTTQTAPTISIHDPSIVMRDGQYTIWGSHLGCATSTDLVTWTTHKAQFVNAATGEPCGPDLAFNTPANPAAPQINAEAYCNRYNDAATWIYGNMWAPDIIYNKEMGRWTMYLSLNGPHWNSIIIMLSADSPTGPFTYEGPIVMGGFNGQTYNGTAAPAIGETDYTRATGETTLPQRYITTRNGDFWPNPIDPCVFYDEEGQLWMTYGSWSGGIFMLRLDPATGLRDYTQTYPLSDTSDPYYGTRIAGGAYVSGEASYIQHIGQYYYLFMTYGGLEPDGGYSMRVFRSEQPTGPYVDGNGDPALFSRYELNFGPGSKTDRGQLLLAAYNHWGNQTVGETAQGHNSAFVDTDGRAYVVYHTKFNNGTAGHQVRLRELYVNEKGWLVAAPFIVDSQQSTVNSQQSTLPGTYHFLLHPYRQDHKNMEEATPVDVTLNADGTIAGAYTGTWSQTEGTDYITLRLGSTTYYGVLCSGTMSGATTEGLERTSLRTVGFTAQSLGGVALWGYKLDEPHAVAYNYKENAIPVKSGTTYSRNIDLLFPTTENTTLTWTSSRPDVISATGKYNPAGLDAAVDVTLTARLASGQYFWQQTYNVKAQKEIIPAGDYLSHIRAYYPCDETPLVNAYDAAQRALLSGTPKPALADDPARFGRCLRHAGGTATTKMPNPLLTADTLAGLTLSFWVKPQAASGCLMSLTSAFSDGGSGARLTLAADGTIAFDDAAGTAFQQSSAAPALGAWTLVTLTCGPTAGLTLYLDAVRKTPTSARQLPAAEVLRTAATLRYLYLGLGAGSGSADCLFDDLLVYDRELSSTDVRALATMMNRVCDFTPAGTGLHGITTSPSPHCYDLAGRPCRKPQHGIYIKDGRKVARM